MALMLTYITINFNINRQYSIYIRANQESRDQRIVGEFRDDYISNGKKGWNVDSGTSVVREATISGFSVKLEDKNEKTLWQLEPELVLAQLSARQPEGAPPLSLEQFNFKRHNVVVDSETVGYVTIGQFTPLLISTNEEEFIFSLTMSVLASAIIGSLLIFAFS